MSAAYLRRGPITDLVVVVDTTDLDGGPPDSLRPHRANVSVRPVSVALDDVLFLGRSLPKSFLTPLARITIVEIASGVPSSEDRHRIASYTTPRRGQVLVGLIRIDLESKTALTNDGLSPLRTQLRTSDEPLRALTHALGIAVDVVETCSADDIPPLFSTRAAALVAFLLSPIAAAGLFAWNLHRTRRTRLALLFFLGMTVLLGLVLCAADHYETKVATPGIALGGAVVMYQLMKTHFGSPPKKASSVFAFAVSLASIVIFFLAIAGPIVAAQLASEKQTTSANGSKVFYDRHTSAEKVNELAALLQKRGVLRGPESGINVTAEGKNHREHQLLIAFADEHAHEEKATLDFYQELANEVSVAIFGGEPVSFVFQSQLGLELARVTSR